LICHYLIIISFSIITPLMLSLNISLFMVSIISLKLIISRYYFIIFIIIYSIASLTFSLIDYLISIFCHYIELFFAFHYAISLPIYCQIDISFRYFRWRFHSIISAIFDITAISFRYFRHFAIDYFLIYAISAFLSRHFCRLRRRWYCCRFFFIDISFSSLAFHYAISPFSDCIDW
jgi:hypothetical protein